MEQKDIEYILNQFALYGDLISFKGFGGGHINNTYVSVRNQAGTLVRYTHQRINKNVFKNPAQVMENIQRVTSHIYAKLTADADGINEGGTDNTNTGSSLINPGRRVLTVVPAKDGLPYYKDKDGEYWRTYLFVENASTYDIMDNSDLAYKVGKAVGTFQNQLSDYAGPALHETIADFHNMRVRYEQLENAASKDSASRLASVRAEFDFLSANRERGAVLTDGLASGKLKRGITHNDTKLNNILFDDKTGEAICVIDLDTVMPGTVLFDTGDLIRTATNTGAEDERDLSKVGFDLELFRSLTAGYISSAGSFLTDYEKSLIAESGRALTQIMAVRFLTDYLNGDVYYKTERDSHNLDRARTQIRLMQSMDEQWSGVQHTLEQLCRTSL